MGFFDDVHKLGAVAGFLVLAHACYVTISYRNDLKIEGTDFTSVPFAVVIECVVGAAACTWGALGFAGRGQHSFRASISISFHPLTITPTQSVHNLTLDTVPSLYNHPAPNVRLREPRVVHTCTSPQ